MQNSMVTIVKTTALFIAFIISCNSAFAWQIVAWGDNHTGQCNVPSGKDFTAIATGGYHSVALKSDGSLAAWGDNLRGQCNVPTGKNFVAIACGRTHSLALKSDGSLVAWGDNLYRQCTVPLGNNFTTIACGRSHSIAKRQDGSLVAWGHHSVEWVEGRATMVRIADAIRNYHAQVGPSGPPPTTIIGYGGTSLGFTSQDLTGIYFWPSDFSMTVISMNPLMFVITAVSPNYVPQHVTLDQDNRWTPGEAAFFRVGQCDVPTGTGFTAIAGGGYHSLGLKSNGTIAGWGDNSYGECNSPTGNFAKIDGGGWHSVGIKSDGSLAAWGSNLYGQSIVPTGNDFVAVAAGQWHSLALRSDGTLIAWGNNRLGWTEGEGMMMAIATAVRAYQRAVGLQGQPPTTITGCGDGKLKFEQGDLDGIYFLTPCFVVSATLINPPMFVVTGNSMGAISQPPIMTLDQSDGWLMYDGGRWMPGPVQIGEPCAIPTGKKFVAIAAGDYHCVALAAETGDFEPDGDVDFKDVGTFAGKWLSDDCTASNNWCDTADFRQDGKVDFCDFAQFASHWQ